MIGKAGTGSDFRGLARYLLREREGEEGRVAWTLVRNMPVEAEHAASLMDATAAQNVRAQKLVYHLSLSAAPGEELDRERWEKVVDRVLRDLGLEEHQALVVRHTDARHDHVHVMVNRVVPDVNYSCAPTTIRPVQPPFSVRRRRGRSGCGKRAAFSKGCGKVPGGRGVERQLSTPRQAAGRGRRGAGRRGEISTGS